MNWGNGECFIELDEVTDDEQVQVISNLERVNAGVPKRILGNVVQRQTVNVTAN